MSEVAGAGPRAWPPVLGAVLCVLTLLAIAIAAIPLGTADRVPWESTVSASAVAAAFVCVGGLITVRKSRNPIGWTMLGAGAFFTLDGIAGAYAFVDYRLHAGTLPLGALAVLMQPAWAPAIVLIAVSLLIFPDGRLLAGRARWVVWGLVAIGAVWLVGAYGISISVILQHHIRIDSRGTLVQRNPATGAWAWWNVAQDVFFVAVGVSVVFWIVMQATQYRKLTGERRIQQKWLISGALVCPISGFIVATQSGGTSHLSAAVSDVATALLAALPISIGVAILKVRLYEIDRVISRTLSYVLLTGILVGVYVGIIAVATQLLPFSSSVAVGLSTLVAVAVFNPLRRRVQRLVDRRFNRARFDAAATVTGFSERIRTAVAQDVVVDDLLTAVNRTLEPVQASVWLRPDSPMGPDGRRGAGP